MPTGSAYPVGGEEIVAFGGKAMSRARYLHAQAERCFRLANGSAGLQIADELEALGRAFEQEAREIEEIMEGPYRRNGSTAVLSSSDLGQAGYPEMPWRKRSMS